MNLKDLFILLESGYFDIRYKTQRGKDGDKYRKELRLKEGWGKEKV